jgi:hypothetical protein
MVAFSPPDDAASGESLFDRLPSAETVRQAVAAARP